MVLLSLFAYLIATILWFYGEAYFLKETTAGNYKYGLFCAAWGVISVPLFAFGTYYLYKYKASWALVQFPYWIMSIAISYWAFRSVTNTAISWREVAAALLLIVIAFLLGG